MEKDDFGDRMKLYEQAEAGRHLLPLVPVIARLDGKSFHTWTADLKRPYDERMTKLMQSVTRSLVRQTNARIGYVQSDEISLVFYTDDMASPIFFDGKVQKMVSVLSSMASAYFNGFVPDYFEAERPLAFFDCRVWSVPNKVEAANAILWREQDAAKNSISMAARAFFKHSEVMNKSGPEMQEMMFKQHGVNWNNYPPEFKRGTFVRRKTFKKALEPEVLAKIPEKFRPAADTLVERTDVFDLPMPKFSTVINRVEVVFDGAEPLTLKDNS